MSEVLCDLPPKATKCWKPIVLDTTKVTKGSMFISINRRTRSRGTFAIFFQHFDIIREFEEYTNEEETIAKAKAWCASKGDPEPKIIYPTITSMKIKTGKARVK